MKRIIIAVAVVTLAAAVRAQDQVWNNPEATAALAKSAADQKAASGGEDAAAAQAQAADIKSTQQLLDMRRKTLEALYKRLAPGPIPDGPSDGIASREPGTWYGRISQAALGAFWQGKVFDAANGQLINRLTTGKAVKAKVFYGESWLDGKPSIIIDYKDTSGVAGFIRDEIREAAPGIYYGFAFERQQDGSARADIIFALDFNTPKLPKPAAPARRPGQHP